MLSLSQFNQGIAFAVAEIFLPVGCEDFLDAHALFFLNIGIHFHDFHCQKLAQLGGNSAFARTHEADEQDIFIKQRFRLNPLAVFDNALEDMQDFLLKYSTCYLSGNPFQLFFLLLRLQNG